MKNRFPHLVSLSTVCATLAGCGGAPGDADILKALQTRAAAERQAMERVAGKGAAELFGRTTGQVRSARKIGCKEEGEKAYRCDVELEIDQGGSVIKGPSSVRLVKGSDGWMVSQ